MKRGNSVWLQYHNTEGWWDEYPDCSMVEFLQETAMKYPQLTALEFQGKKTKYSELTKTIDSTAAGLLEAGISKGDYVTIISPNMPEALISIYALNRIGAVANILHPMLSSSEIFRFIKNVNSKAIIILDMIYPKISQLDFSGKIILMHIGDDLPWYAKPFYEIKNRRSIPYNTLHDVMSWKSLQKHNIKNLMENDGKGENVAVILYSGGSSGTPKGCAITNYNMNCLAVQSHDVYERDDIQGTHSLALMPLFHGFGLGVCMHGMLCNALHVFLIPKYDMKETTRLIFKRKISFLFGVPALYEALARSVEIEKNDLSFIHFLVVAGDKPNEKLLARINRQLERGGSTAKIREAYGQTECTSGCCINPFFCIKEGSIGIPYTDMLMKICEPGSEKEMQTGQSGEICISGPTVMKEYINNPEETAKTLRCHSDGLVWLHTGDAGHVDENGYYYFDQRLSRMIISSGYNVYPTEVEKAILRCRIVKACCVVGVPDSIAGQLVRAYVVLNDSTGEQEYAKARILEACKNLVVEYSIPKQIIFVDELPVSSLGKVDYKKLESI